MEVPSVVGRCKVTTDECLEDNVLEVLAFTFCLTMETKQLEHPYRSMVP
jgi:hypothetical protein